MTVEMFFLLPIIALVLVSLMEVGYLWLIRHTLTNASREGARVAVVYAVIPGTTTMVDEDTRKGWAEAAVTNYLTGTNFPGSHTTTVNFPAGHATGDPVTVTVTSPSALLLLDKFIPAFDGITLSAATTMRLE